LKNSIVYRGVVATDNIDGLLKKVKRENWVIIQLSHYIGIPQFHKEYDLYQIDPYISKETPKPHIYAIIRDFVDENKFFPLDIEKKYDIIFVARWRYVKRHWLMLETLKYAKEQGRPIKCLCFGIIINDECKRIKQEVIDQVKNHDLPVDIIPQKWNRVIVNQRYNLAKAILLCSECESGPVVMSEALLCGLPCVSTIDTKGPQNNYINDLTGIIAGEKPESIAHCIWYAIDNVKEYRTREWALKNMCLSVGKLKFENAINYLIERKKYNVNTNFRFDDEIYDWNEDNNLVDKYEYNIANAISVYGNNRKI